jgi:hypothetical protein
MLNSIFSWAKKLIGAWDFLMLYYSLQLMFIYTLIIPIFMKTQQASDFMKYETRFHLAHPPNPEQKILREIWEQWRRPVIGNNNLMDELEDRIDRFLQGDIEVDQFAIGKAPERCILIYGPPQSGKSTLADYLASYAVFQAQNGVNVDLSLVTFNLVSPYQNGNIMKLVSQTKEVKRNPERKYLIVQDNFNYSVDQSDSRLVSEFCRFMDDESLDNYLLLGLTDGDTRTNIQPKIRDRFQAYFWEGAVSPDQKADLILVNTYLSNAFDIKDEEYRELGQLAHELKLSGGEISGVCSKATSSTVNPDYMKANAPLRTHQVNSDTMKEMMIKYANSPKMIYAKSQAP